MGYIDYSSTMSEGVQFNPDNLVTTKDSPQTITPHDEHSQQPTNEAITLGNKEEPEEITRLRREIYQHTGGRENTNDQETLTFFPREEGHQIDLSPAFPPGTTDPKTTQEKIENGVETVLTNLQTTLREVGLSSLQRYQENSLANADYLKVAKTVNMLALALQQTGQGNVTFERNLAREQDYKKKDYPPPDEVYIFVAKNVVLEGKYYNNIEFFIRPSSFKSENLSEKGEPITRQNRIELSITSPQLPKGVASVRIDPPRVTRELTFDIIVGENKDNTIETLDLATAGQQAGHHFPSKHSAADLGIGSMQVYMGAALRLNDRVPNHPPLGTSTT